MSNVLCITGMHRSGTSLTASWLKKSGLVIDNGFLYNIAPGNIKGHFEDKDFADFHSSVIKYQKLNSKGWKFYTKDNLFFTETQLNKAKELIKLRNSRYETWSWKDPRTTFFLEQWKELIPNFKVLLVWRPAQKVIQSLIKRSHQAQYTQFKGLQVNLIESINLWLSYNNLVFKYKQAHPESSILIPLTSILKEDKKVIDLINNKFDMNLIYYPVQNIYNSNLLHHKTNNFINLICYCIPKISQLEEKLKKLSDL